MLMLTWQGYGTDGIDRMVTLGSPHQAPPKVRSLLWPTTYGTSY